MTGGRQPASSFKVKANGDEAAVLDVAKRADYQRAFVDDPELCEYFVPIQWLQTVPLDQAVREIGFFGNQNTVCQPKSPKWRATVEHLKEKFPNFDKE